MEPASRYSGKLITFTYYCLVRRTMTFRGPTDALPGNLSDQQLFVLALLATQHDPDEEQPVKWRYRYLSRKAAWEFDDDGTRVQELDSYPWERLTDDHAASFSRTIKRLEERGYVERDRYGGARDEAQTEDVVLTDRGLRAGRESIRRHQDGRYSLSFDKLDPYLDAAD